MNFSIIPSDSTPETEQATRILLWMDSTILPSLGSPFKQIYHGYRYNQGSPAITRRGRMFPGGPNLPIPPMPVEGTGDAAFGHNRLALIIDHLIIPMIKKGELNLRFAIELQRKCRGEFPRECMMIHRALSQASIRKIEKDVEDILESGFEN